MRPSRSDSWASAASSGSTPITRASGQSALTAVATPEIRPPPPTQTTTVATSGRSCDDLEPDRSLAGDDARVVERRDVLERARRRGSRPPRAAAPRSSSRSGRSRRPSAAVRATFTGAAFSGITIVAGTPSSAAAAATPCAWFPLESATTPRSIRSRRRRRERVEGAAELERAGALEALRLDVDLAARAAAGAGACAPRRRRAALLPPRCRRARREASGAATRAIRTSARTGYPPAREHRPDPGRAPHRLGLDGGDRGAARARARGAVPGAGVRRDPPPARRVGRRPPARRRDRPRPARR